MVHGFVCVASSLLRPNQHIFNTAAVWSEVLVYVLCWVLCAAVVLQDEAPLLTPNVLICSVGTEIFYRGPDGRLLPDDAWETYLDQGWDRAAVQAVAAKITQLTPQVNRAMQ